jgi:hypothetical protein
MCSIFYGISENECIDVTDNILKYLKKGNKITINDNINNIIGIDPYINMLKNLYIYKDNKLIKTIKEYDNKICNLLSIEKIHYLIDNKPLPFGFIILRHVRCIMSNTYWNECIRSIRKFHPDTHILIIDDASDKKYIFKEPDIDITNNCVTIDSEYKGSGELLPYYYYHKIRHCEKVIILHDTVFLNSNISDHVNDVKTFKYLWYFTNIWKGSRDNIINAFDILKHNDDLYNYFDSTQWFGCFGGMMALTLEMLDGVVEFFDMFKLLDIIKSRPERQNFERIIAILFCKYTEYINKDDDIHDIHDIYDNTHISLFGNIFDQPDAFNLTMEKYIKNKSTNINLITKVWSGR